MRTGAVVLPTLEVRLVAGTAVHANCPEVVGGQLLTGGDNGRHTVGAAILEPKGLAGVDIGVPGEHNSTCIQQLLAVRLGRVHTGVGVQVGDIVVRPHVALEVGTAKHQRYEPAEQEGHRDEKIPRGLAVSLAGPFPPDGLRRHDGTAENHQEAEQANEGAQLRVLVVYGEGQDPKGHHEGDPRHKEARGNRDDVCAPPALQGRPRLAGGSVGLCAAIRPGQARTSWGLHW
mmetsp:Transcript_90644/g.210839  ORF Transcript_90644/g.210839 Transcript_90644/m.210839 type:complete len:231 (+) Transcript_90644:354-1046(+)